MRSSYILNSLKNKIKISRPIWEFSHSRKPLVSGIMSSRMIGTHAILPSHHKSLFSNLFPFIKNNTVIPTYLHNVNQKDPKPHALLAAIQQGDFHADIFADANCYLYLLHLMKEEKINFWHGMTVYSYLMALMQFTEKQPLREEDADVKTLGEVFVDKLVDNEKIAPLGEVYIKNICMQLEKINYELNEKDLTTFILGLPPVEQALIRIKHSHAQTSDNMVDKTIKILLHNIPLLQNLTTEEMICYCVPSASIINYILQKIAPDLVNMQPIFGSIKPTTLSSFHDQEKHPVALYATGVKSNPYSADDLRCGPFLMWLHDIGHTFWGNMLTAKERKTIFQHFIPNLNLLKKEAEQCNDQEVVKKINKVIDQAFDFDLTDIDAYSTAKERFAVYLLGSFGKSFFMPEEKYDGIGTLVADRLFFLINKMVSSSVLREEKNIWQNILTRIQEQTTQQELRRPSVMWALSALARNAFDSDLKFLSQQSSHIEWSAWFDILNSTTDSEAIWKSATSTPRVNELLELVTYHQLAFFHPYLPLTPEKHAQFKLFVQAQIELQADLKNDQRDNDGQSTVGRQMRA